MDNSTNLLQKNESSPDLGGRDFAVSLMEHLAVATFVLDLHGNVIIWNRACQRLTGVAATEVLGTSNHWTGFYDHPRETLADLILYNRTAKTDSLYEINRGDELIRDGLSVENWCEMPRVDGRHYLAIDSGPIYDSEGKLVAVVETLRDMTAQKEAQMALELLATHDGLTGLANRRRFDQAAATEWSRYKRDGRPLGLLIVDVDNFKHFNDTHGHLGGDDCLKHVADVLRTTVHRGGDLVARYGGEEFAILLPNQTPAGALALAETARLAVDNLSVPNLSGAGSDHVTISIGVAVTTGAPEEDLTSLIAAADAALYNAKNSGRNRSVLSERR